MDFIYGCRRQGIDFIAAASLVLGRAELSGHAASRDLSSCMECSVEDIDTAFGHVQETDEASGAEYAPRDFLRQFGAVIAICLGLALLAHVLVTVVGEY